jgi:predicted RNA-binding Zn-ribbon protein involved in translation (DUF1610 family)
MDHQFCPGSRALRQPTPEISTCASCGSEVEIWSDEVKATCPSCKKTVFKDNAMGCLEWCRHGEECVGTDIYATYRQNRAVGLKHRLLEAVAEYFGDDRPRIEHAQAVLEQAELLAAAEGADAHIVIPAAILHDVGIKVAEAKHGSADARLQELEGPPVARKMLLAAGARADEIDEICDIVAHHHTPGVVDSVSFRVVYDADCLVNLAHAPARDGLIDRTFLTSAGKARAEELFRVATRA